MSEHISGAQLDQAANVSAQPVQTKVDRNFGLPGGLYVATVALYVGFIGLMATLFLNPELIIPMVVFVAFIVFAFGVAGFWSKMKPDNEPPPLSWGQFASRGIQTLSGKLTASEAALQVLILPGLIFVWGLAIVVICAVVR